MEKAFLLFLIAGALAACDKAAPPFDPLPAPGDQEMIINSLGEKLYRNIPEITSLEQRSQLQDWSGWYRHKGKFYIKGQII
jgi:hypothetical protein